MGAIRKLLDLVPKSLGQLKNWATQNTCLRLKSIEDGDLEIWPCRLSKPKFVLSVVLTVLTVGFLRLLFYWRPLLHALATCDLCDPENAKLILINHNGEYSIRKLRIATGPDGLTLFCPGGTTVDVPFCRYFSYKKLIFAWYPTVSQFQKIFGFDCDVPLALLSSQRGLMSSEAKKRLAIYGSNEIAVQLKPIPELLFREVFSPFYIFQMFSVGLWFAEDYEYYAIIIIVVTTLSATVTVWQTRRNQRNLRDTMHSVGVATVRRDGEWKRISTAELVPGDVIAISDIGEIHCDAVLLSGTAIVNEAMLTGESVPTTKTPMHSDKDQSNERYHNKEHAKHTLFCGTKILQTKHARGRPVVAVVIRTGFNTIKGRLVRTIMYPKPIQSEFTRDLFRFIGVCTAVAFVGFVYTVVLMVQRGNGFGMVAIRALDIITIVVPPALPTAITVGIIVIQGKLKQAFIYCTSPSAIHLAGAVNVACFDKTGTLTEDGLDFFGAVPANKFDAEQCVTDLLADSEMIRAMACCHSLTYLNDQLAGDPMEITLFKKTGWKLEHTLDPGVACETPSESWGDGQDGTPDELAENNRELLTVKSADRSVSIKSFRVFPFTSALRRMSVIAEVQTFTSSKSENTTSNLFLYCKGAPETVATLCSPDTVPSRCFDVLQTYAKCGYRIIALANKRLNYNGEETFSNSNRTELEQNLTFLGFVVFENRLKEQTAPQINILKRARIRPVMVTGDNLLTAVAVAKQCGMLDNQRRIYTVEADLVDDLLKIIVQEEAATTERTTNTSDSGNAKGRFSTRTATKTSQKATPRQERLVPGAKYQLAIEGSSYSLISSKAPHLLPKLTAVCDVYARMSPEQKVQLVTNLQELGYTVSMCGDGANDCGALKVAHVGCSLSEAEASIASPFTSKIPNISCITTLIREGRASLVTTFGIVRYMCIYSLTQFLAVVILYWIGTFYSPFQFLYSDFILTATYAILFGYTGSSPILSPIPPPTHILTLETVISITAQMVWIAAFQIFSFEFVKLQPWFVPFIFPGDENSWFAYQTTCLFFTMSFQQVVLCTVYSKSKPYRRSILNNYALTAALTLTTAATITLLLAPGPALADILTLKLPPDMKYRGFMFMLSVLHFFVATATEEMLEYVGPRLMSYLPFEKKKPKYAEILSSEVVHSPDWLTNKASRANGMVFVNNSFRDAGEV